MPRPSRAHQSAERERERGGRKREKEAGVPVTEITGRKDGPQPTALHAKSIG